MSKFADLRQRLIAGAPFAFDHPGHLEDLDRSLTTPADIPELTDWLLFLESHASNALPREWVEFTVPVVRRLHVELLIEAMITKARRS